MAKRLDLLPRPVVEEEEVEVDMEAEEEEMCDLASRRTQKVLEWIVTERLAGRVTTDTTACCLAAALATAGPPSLRVRARSDKVKKDKAAAAEEMAQPRPPIKCVGKEESHAPDAAAAAQIGREAESAASTADGCKIRVVSAPTWDA